MIRRTLSVMVAGLLVVSAAIDLVAQSATPRTSDKPYAALRTPWGHPDLQGIWTSDDARSVPLQRPAEFGQRRLLTDQEYATMNRLVVTAAVAVASMTLALAQTVKPQSLLQQVDHLVYATPDLDLGIATIDRLLGVRATAGGQHPGLGTRNALVALGPASYLEIIGPDPGQPKPAGPRRFGLDELKAPRLLTWVAKGTNLEALVVQAQARGVALGTVLPGSRKRPDGVLLSWRYTDPNTVLMDRLVPFLIDWGSSPHPSAAAARGATLVQLRAEHPEPDRAQKMLDALGLRLRVDKGPVAALIATIEGPRGRVDLR